MPIQINLADQRDPDLVRIRLMRPISLAVEVLARGQDAPILPPPTPMTFSRAEWALLVSSGLLHALGTGPGWRDWDDATVFRAASVTEKDHLLVVASLLLQGHDFGHGQPWPPGLAQAGAAIHRINERAAKYREQEGITTPLDPGLVSLGANFHEGRIWFSNHDLPNPSFQSPLLEHAVEETHVETLVDLAKHGEEATFKELAQTLGVPAEKLDELWAGTIRRVKP